MQPDEFKTLVRDYSAALEQQLAAAAELKTLRARVREMQGAILQHMQDNSIDECEWTGGRLVRKKQKKTEGLKKEHIQGELRKLVADDAAVAEAVDSMYNRRLTDVQETLAVLKSGGGGGGDDEHA